MRADVGHRSGAWTSGLLRRLFCASLKTVIFDITFCRFRQVMLRNAHKLNLQNVTTHCLGRQFFSKNHFGRQVDTHASFYFSFHFLNFMRTVTLFKRLSVHKTCRDTRDLVLQSFIRTRPYPTLQLIYLDKKLFPYLSCRVALICRHR